MRWKKFGKIFDPTDHALSNGCVEFAQSPQTLVFDDFVRVYFATRAPDNSGKFLSHVAFVDFAIDLREILRVSTETVVPLGELGNFDEHGIFPMNVVRHAGKIYGYTTGWNRRISVSVDTAIGLVSSVNDGLTFQPMGRGPVLAATLHEPFLVGDGFVKVIDAVFHMWYIFGTKWTRFEPNSPPDRTYKIGHASSANGIDWNKDSAAQIIPDRIGQNESQALPTVLEIDGRHHMFFCYRESFDFRANKERGYRIGHAYSDDLVNWVRDDDDPLLTGTPGDWDSDMQCYPHVFELLGKVYLLYNGNEFGRTGFGIAELEL
jgi:hypothetical protein